MLLYPIPHTLYLYTRTGVTIFLLNTVSYPVFSQELVPTSKEAVLKATVINERGGANNGDTILFTSVKTGLEYSGVTDANGKFSLLMPNNDNYKIKYRDLNGDYQENSIEIPDIERLTFRWELTHELPRTYTLDNVFFSTGQSTLRPESFKELNDLVEVMNYKKTLQIEIAGHTDDVGNDDANQKLSEARAKAVRAYLIKKGIEATRVSAVGYGNTQPIAGNDTPEGRQKNRRTEVRIMKQ